MTTHHISTTGYGAQHPAQAVAVALRGLQSAVATGTRMERRAAIDRLQSAMDAMPQVPQPLTHHFTEGLYGREIFNPKGCLIVTKIHKAPNFSFILKGKLSVITEEGEDVLEAPGFFITKPGTKRVLYSHEDTVFMTVHPNPTNTDNLETLEAGIIAGSHDEVGTTTVPTLEER